MELKFKLPQCIALIVSYEMEKAKADPTSAPPLLSSMSLLTAHRSSPRESIAYVTPIAFHECATAFI
jgi:hypothetical protein